jgi:hypothetical protein
VFAVEPVNAPFGLLQLTTRHPVLCVKMPGLKKTGIKGKMMQMLLKNSLFSALVCLLSCNALCAEDLKLDDIFPTDRVLDVQITVAPGDWDTIRYQWRQVSQGRAAQERLHRFAEQYPALSEGQARLR